jgi:hypothetical protein
MSNENVEEKENINTANQFKVLISNVSSVDTVSIKNQIFYYLKSLYLGCHLLVANNNDKTTLQPHMLNELNSIRIYMKTQASHLKSQIRESLCIFLISYYKDSFANHYSLIHTQVTIAEERHFSSIVKWVTYGGDHDPRFTAAILPHWFSRYYKINEWARRNVTKKFTLLDEFVLNGDTSQSYLIYIEHYLERYKINVAI